MLLLAACSAIPNDEVARYFTANDTKLGAANSRRWRGSLIGAANRQVKIGYRFVVQ